MEGLGFRNSRIGFRGFWALRIGVSGFCGACTVSAMLSLTSGIPSTKLLQFRASGILDSGVWVQVVEIRAFRV